MSPLSRTHLLPALAVVLAALASAGPAGAQAEKKPISNRVDFQTADGVVIKGTMYPAQGEKKEAVVILLHHFDMKKGGSSKKDGWQDLAAALQADGYPVLSFDFRGFGDSTEVSKEKFWSKRHNGLGGFKTSAVKKKAASISHTQFQPAYYANLVSDIAAARAYLERRNDAGEVNCSSIILIGAGDGAAAGAAWMYNEARRRRDKTMAPMPGFVAPVPASIDADPESKDIAAAIWLSISPTIGGRDAYLKSWTVEAGRRQKIPIAFLNGKAKDVKSRNIAEKLLAEIKPAGAKPKEAKEGAIGKEKDGMKLTGMKVFETELVGERLLDADLGTFKWIKDHLKEVLEERGNKERTDRESAKSRFLYTVVGKSVPLMRATAIPTPRVSKDFGQDAPFVDVDLLYGK